MGGLTEKEYQDYFDIAKIFSVYMKIFGNQQFNQSVEKLSMKYVTRLLHVFTDKRARDYQDVKNFISSASLLTSGFLKEKEVTEMFKTRRKRKKE
jgi:hypothetical protein